MRLRPRKLLEVFAQIREDWEVHGRDWTQPGFRALAVHRLGWWLRLERGRNPLWFVPWRLYQMMFRYIRNNYGIDLSPHTVVGRRVSIAHQTGVVIHGCVVIGDDCIIRQNATLGALNGERSQEAPTLGRSVHIGCGAAVLGPVTIGDGARIGPNAVVMTDIPAGATVFVNPPRTMVNLRPRAADEKAEVSRVAVGATRA